MHITPADIAPIEQAHYDDGRDGQGVPKAVLKTTELTERPFDEVDEGLA